MKNVLIIIFCLSLFSCNMEKKSIPDPISFLEGVEKFNVKDFFNKSQEGFAVILDSNDKIISKFIVKSSGDWDGNKGTIKFEYKYSKDKSDFRTWLITLNDKNNYTIVGHDFLEPAKGRQKGNVSELLYKMSYTFNNKKSDYYFVDNIYQVNKDSAILITQILDQGKLVGKIISSISRKPIKKISKLTSPKFNSPVKPVESGKEFESSSETRG